MSRATSGPPSPTQVGDTHGRLTVVAQVLDARTGRWYRCECKCGGEIIVPGYRLRKGDTRSCGCLSAEKASARMTERGPYRGGRKTHGYTGTRTYNSWTAMRKRCEDENNTSYKNYGARGVRVCERWATFREFLIDMGERPAGKTLDRIDPDGNYEPGNCRWATAREQRANQRRRIVVTETERLALVRGLRFNVDPELAALKRQIANK